MPGAGLGRPKSRSASQAEAAYEDALRDELNASVAEHTAEASLPTEFGARVTESDAFNPMARTSLTLDDLLPVSEAETIFDVPILPSESTPRKPRAHEALVAGADIFGVDESHLKSSSQDHKPEGALDSAWNRSVGGFPWVETYLSLLSALGLFSSVCRVETNEVFRFGDGGRLRASWRYRLPMCCYGVPILCWISVVDSDAFKLLLGKDLLKSVGGRICFHRSLFYAFRLGLRDKVLTRLPQGHYRLGLLDQPFVAPTIVPVARGVSGENLEWSKSIETTFEKVSKRKLKRGLWRPCSCHRDSRTLRHLPCSR